MEKQIKINKSWFQGLMDISNRIKTSQEPAQKELILHLLGYIESAKLILNQEDDTLQK